MIGLPEIGTKAWIRPAHGRKVQDGPRPVNRFGGGRWLVESREIVWTPFHLEQLRAGDIILASAPVTAATPSPVPAAAPTLAAKE